MWWVIHHSICNTKRSSSCWSLYYLFIVCLIVMSKAFLKKWHTKPILFEFFASAMCIRQIYECNQLHRYILCVVVVIVCNEHWDQGIQIEMACNSKCFLVALISVNTIWIISIYLAQNWAVSQWLSFRTPDLNALYLYCLCEQTAKVDRSHYIISLSHHKLIRNFNLFQPNKISKFSDRLYTCIVNNCYTDTQNNLTRITLKAQGIY